MKSNYQRKIVGLLFLAGGICYLGEQLGIWDISVFFPGWWTIFLILPALISMVESGIHMGNVLLFIIGGYFLMEANGWISVTLTFGAIAAIICILIGVRMIVGKHGRRIHRHVDASHARHIHSNVVFGNRSFRGTGHVDSLEAQCLVGTQYIDISDADVHNMSSLELNCVFGTINLIVPDDMNFIVKQDNFLGSCSIQDEPEGKYDLYVDVSCILGQINLRKKCSQHVKEGKFKDK